MEKRVFRLLLALALAVLLAPPLHVSAQELTLGQGYMKNHNGFVTIWGEAQNADPEQELYLELYAGDDKIARTQLNDIDGIYAAATDSLTWHFTVLGEEEDPYWTTTWEPGHPNASSKPTKAVLYLDGQLASEGPVLETSPDDLAPVTWSELFAAELNGKTYGSIQAAIQAAGTDPATIRVLNHITSQPQTGITIAQGQTITLDLGGHTLKGDIMVHGTAQIQNGAIQGTRPEASAIESNGGQANLTVEDLTVTSLRHGLRIDGGRARIRSGHYSTRGTGTVHAVNISTNAEVIIDGGEFTGAATTSGGSAVATRDKNTALTIHGGTFRNPNGPHTLALWGGTIAIHGGTFHKAAEDTLNLGGTETANGTGKVTGITGGIFEDMPDVQLLAQGKAALRRADGWYEITKAKAQILGKGNYATVQEAVAAAAKDQTVKLLDDVTEDITVAVPITLDLDDKALTGTVTLTQRETPLTIRGTGTHSAIRLAAPSKTGYESGVYEGQTRVETAAVRPEGAVYQANWELTAPSVTISADRTSIEKEKGTALLTATGTHALPLSYQWYQDGAPITGATEDTYQVTGLTQNATFSCLVTVRDDGNAKEAISESVTIQVAAQESMITIGAESLTATLGQQEPLTFSYTKTQGMPDLTVESANPSVATVQDHGGTVTVTILAAGTTEITLSFPGSEAFTAASASITLTVASADSQITAPEISGTYGDILSLTAHVAMDQGDRASGEGKVVFSFQGTKLGEGNLTYTDATTGTAALPYPTTEGTLPVGTSRITLEYSGGPNLEPSIGFLTVTLAPKPLTVTGLTALDRTYDGTTTVALSGGKVEGLIAGDDVVPSLPTSGTLESAQAGQDKAVQYTLPLRGSKADFYTLVKPALTADIAQAELTATYVSQTITNLETPQLKVEVTGFAAGETPATAQGYVAPKVTHTASGVGTYTLTPSGGSATNYRFAYEAGTLTVGYAITKGTGQTVIKGSAATFHTNVPHSKFDSVLVDGKKLNSSAYTLTEDSTRITLSAGFIRGLKAGEHTLTIRASDADAVTSFQVKNAPWSPDTPQTGDTTGTGLWLTFALVGMAGVLCALWGKKYLRKNQ